MTFKRAATDRNLPFKEISEVTGVREDEVELLVMKALAQGLLKGTIDQVNLIAHFTWVQPRVLDKKQVNKSSCFYIYIFKVRLITDLYFDSFRPWWHDWKVGAKTLNPWKRWWRPKLRISSRCKTISSVFETYFSTKYTWLQLLAV